MRKTSDQSKKESAKKTTQHTKRTVKEAVVPAKEITASTAASAAAKPGQVTGRTFSTAAKIGLAAIILLAALAGYAYNRYWVVATVNGQPISRLDYIRTMEKQVGKQTLDNLITENLIRSEAAKKGITVSQKEVDDQLAQIENQLKSQNETLDQALAAQGMTKSDLIDQIKLQKMVEVLGAGTVNITDDQITKFLAENKDQLPKNETQDQLKQYAKTQLESQTKNENIRNWLTNLRSTAVIQYR